MKKTKTTILTVVALFSGSLAALLIFNLLRGDASKIHVTDDQAVKMGYFSDADWQKVQEDQRKYLADLDKPGGWGDENYRYAAETLAHGSTTSKKRLIYATAGMGDRKSRLRILKILDGQPMSSSDVESWQYVFTTWINSKSDPNTLSDLEKSSNRQVVEFAKKMRANHSGGIK